MLPQAERPLAQVLKKIQLLFLAQGGSVNGLRVDEVQDPLGLGGGVLESRRDLFLWACPQQVVKRQGAGAVQVLDPGQVHVQLGRHHLGEARPKLPFQVVDLVQGNAPRQDKTDGLACLALNAEAVRFRCGCSLVHVWRVAC